MHIVGISTRCRDDVIARLRTASHTLQGRTRFAYAVRAIKDITSQKKYVYLRMEASEQVEIEEAIDLLKRIQQEAGQPTFAARLVGAKGERQMVYF